MLLNLLLLLHLIVQFLLLTLSLRFEVRLLLLFLTSTQLRFPFGGNQITGMLVQIKLEVFSFKRLVCIRNELAVFLNLFDLIQVRLQIFTCVGSVHPFRSLLDDFLYIGELDDLFDVSAVMGSLKKSVVTVIFQL